MALRSDQEVSEDPLFGGGDDTSDASFTLWAGQPISLQTTQPGESHNPVRTVKLERVKCLPEDFASHSAFDTPAVPRLND